MNVQLTEILRDGVGRVEGGLAHPTHLNFFIPNRVF